MIIDLTGLPGAGKTTLEKHLLPKLREHGLRVVTRVDLKTSHIRKNYYKRYRRESIAHIPFRILLYLQRTAGLIMGTWAQGLKPEVICRPGCFSPCSWLYEDMELSSHFLDDWKGVEGEGVLYFAREGIVHHSACVRVWVGARYAGLKDRWLRESGAREVLILYVRVPKEEALRRLQTRGLPATWPGPARKSDEEIMAILARFNEAIRETLAEFEAAGARVLNVDGMDDPVFQSQKIMTAIENMQENPVQ